MDVKKEKTNENENPVGVEDLAKFIKDSEEMNSEPKKKMSLRTKAILIVILGILLIVLDIIFIHKPYEFRLDFDVKDYSVYEYTFKALGNKTVIYDKKTIEVGENIVNILPYVNYTDVQSKYIVMLSEYGRLYTYNLSNDSVKLLENVTENIADISVNKLDVYDVIEVTLEDGTKKVLGNEKLLDTDLKNLKIMDKIIFRHEDYIVYLLDDDMYICDYNKVRHFRMETEDYYAETMTNPKKIVDLNNNAIKYKDGKAFVYEDNMYVYGLTKDGKLTVYTYTLGNYLNLPENITVQPIVFTKEIIGFDEYTSDYSIRLDIGAGDKTIDVFLDKLMFGSLSNDNFVMTYITDFSNGINYNNVEDKNGNYRYEGEYYTFYDYNKKKNEYSIICAFLTSYDKLATVTFYFDENNKFSYICDYPEFKENQAIEKIYKENDKMYITIKEVTKSEFIVFEDKEEINYKTFLLEDFVKE